MKNFGLYVSVFTYLYIFILLTLFLVDAQFAKNNFIFVSMSWYLILLLIYPIFRKFQKILMTA